jgi:hypothetical protein
MGTRIDMDWKQTKITDELLLDVFHPVAKQLSGLILQEHANGQMLLFLRADGCIQHMVSNIGNNNWVCFCPDALDDECAATIFARARLLKDLEAKD